MVDQRRAAAASQPPLPTQLSFRKLSVCLPSGRLLTQVRTIPIANGPLTSLDTPILFSCHIDPDYSAPVQGLGASVLDSLATTCFFSPPLHPGPACGLIAVWLSVVHPVWRCVVLNCAVCGVALCSVWRCAVQRIQV